MNRMLTVTIGAALAMSCSSQDSKAPCPAKGIGIEATDGTPCKTALANPDSEAGKSCVDQITGYAGYDCAQPQICADRGVFTMSDFVLDPKNPPPPQPISVILTNCSSGNQPLLIEGVQIAGDVRCSFSAPEYENKPADPGREIVVQTKYKPTQVGEDQAALLVFTNAFNLSPLVIPVCGRALAVAPAPVGDGGATKRDGGTSAPVVCKEPDLANLKPTTCK